MCNPAAFVAAQAVGTFLNDNANAKSANEQSKKNYAKTVELVGRQTILKQHSNQQERIQLAARASTEINAISEEAAKTTALHRVSSGESGVAGSGVMQVLQDFRAQEAKAALNEIRSLENVESAGESELRAITLAADSALAGALPTEVEGGSLAQLAISVGAAYAGGKAASAKTQLAAGITEPTFSFRDIFIKGPTDF